MYNYTHIQLIKMVMNCRVCRRMINSIIASEVGSHTSKKKAKSSRRNGKFGGRPKRNKK